MKLRIFFLLITTFISTHTMNIHNKGLSDSEITGFYVNQMRDRAESSDTQSSSRSCSSMFDEYSLEDHEFTFSARNNKKDKHKTPSVEYLCSIIIWQESKIAQLEEEVNDLDKNNKKLQRRVELLDDFFVKVVTQVDKNRSDINKLKGKFLYSTASEELIEEENLFEKKRNRESLRRSKSYELLSKSSVEQLQSISGEKKKKKKKKSLLNIRRGISFKKNVKK